MSDRPHPFDHADEADETDDARIGKILANRYLVERLIGKGGMGAVYRGLHFELGEPLAIKFLLASANAGIRRTRFRREAVALARLRHPGIVSVLDFGEEDGELFMVMELVSGRTLAELIEARELTLTRTVEIFDRILQAIEAAHAQGIVHRDLKPANIMVLDSDDGIDHIKVLDFGLAHLDTGSDVRLTATGAVQGTPLYMSPEQCRGFDVGTPSDIYALGVALFEALTGHTPFEAAESASLMAEHLFVEPPAFRDVPGAPVVPPSIEAMVHRALSKNPDARPTARAFREQLRQALQGTDAGARSAASSAERQRFHALGRAERAPTLASTAVELPPAEPDPTAAVVLWMTDRDRLRETNAALAVNGLRTYVLGGEWSAERADGVGVVVLSAHDPVEARIAEVRRQLPDVPLLVVDVRGDPAALVRAGVSDFALEGTADASLHKKVRRLLRRRR